MENMGAITHFESAIVARPAGESLAGPLRLPPVPWRDPHSVEPAELQHHIAVLERACAENPHNADLRTCLGMAHAMNFDIYKSMDALEKARAIEPDNFFAQLKYSELFYRLRALDRAEVETKRALDLALNHWHLALARKQLADIRKLKREGTQKPAWTKSLTGPVMMLVLMFVILGFAQVWK
jgi:hypothetical protein